MLGADTAPLSPLCTPPLHLEDDNPFFPPIVVLNAGRQGYAAPKPEAPPLPFHETLSSMPLHDTRRAAPHAPQLHLKASFRSSESTLAESTDALPNGIVPSRSFGFSNTRSGYHMPRQTSRHELSLTELFQPTMHPRLDLYMTTPVPLATHSMKECRDGEEPSSTKGDKRYRSKTRLSKKSHKRRSTSFSSSSDDDRELMDTEKVAQKKRWAKHVSTFACQSSRHLLLSSTTRHH